MSRKLFTSTALLFATLFATHLGLAADTKPVDPAQQEIAHIDAKVSALNDEISKVDAKIGNLGTQSEATRKKVKEESARRERVIADAARIRKLDLSVAKVTKDVARTNYSRAVKDSELDPMDAVKKTAADDAEKAFLEAAATLKEAEARYEKELKQVIADHKIPDATADVPAALDTLATQIEREIAELKAKDVTDELRSLREERTAIAHEQMRLLSFRSSIIQTLATIVQREILETIGAVGVEAIGTKNAVIGLGTTLSTKIDQQNGKLDAAYAQQSEVLKQLTAISLNVKEVHSTDFPAVNKKLDALASALRERPGDAGAMQKVEELLQQLQTPVPQKSAAPKSVPMAPIPMTQR